MRDFGLTSQGTFSPGLSFSLCTWGGRNCGSSGATDGVRHLLRKSPREYHATASPESVHASTFLGRFRRVHHSLKDAGSRKPLNTPHTCSSSNILPNASGKGLEIAVKPHHHGLGVTATLDGRQGDLSQCLAAGRSVPGTGLKEGGHWVEQWTAPARSPLLRAEGVQACQSEQQLLRWAWLSQSRSRQGGHVPQQTAEPEAGEAAAGEGQRAQQHPSLQVPQGALRRSRL